MHPLGRLIASLVFGLSVLAFFAFVSVEMATHFFQGVAEDAIRQTFVEDSRAKDGARNEVVCRDPDGGSEGPSECDLDTVKADRSLRSASCSGRSFLHLLGKPWSCVAKFKDGTALTVQVSLGFRRHHLELVLTIREAGADLRGSGAAIALGAEAGSQRR